jgi:hypothetical protein
MLKFCGNNRETGRLVLGIGLSRENCEKLLEGRPIHFHTAGMLGLPEIEVFLLAGESEDAIALDVLRSGALDGAAIQEDPTLAEPHVDLLPFDKGKVN